jgi:HlyD family secretion protein
MRIAVRENQPVTPGELLVRLDSTDASLALTEARAALLQARASFRELTLGDLQNADSTTRAERARIARARSGLDQAEARVARAELDLERTRVTAPFAGRVANLRVVEGQTVRSGDELLSVMALDPIRVEVQVLETEVGLLAPGGRAQVRFAALPGEVFAGRVTIINPVVDEATRTARVTVTARNPGVRILPGMYARVSLEARKFPNRILVPRAAILERDRRTMLFVYEGDESGGPAKWRYVTTGLQNDSLVEIVQHPETEMVRPGEIVLTDGHYTLVHDARVRLVENVREAGGRPQ